MIRALLALIFLALLAWAASWLADAPGNVTLEWWNHRIDTSAAVLVVAMALVAIVAAVLYRFWGFLTGAPTRIGQAYRGHRHRKGYVALTRGMVAVAAGDAPEAMRQGKRADGMLKDPPLTMLLSAQAAQLAGDEQAAATFFTAMLDRPEMEFLGVRGLLVQAMKDGNTDEALRLVERAHRLKPKSEWVRDTLFDLQVRSGQWIEAETTATGSVRRRTLSAPQGRRHKAVAAFEQGQILLAAGDHRGAQKQMQKANDLDPAFVPAAVGLATRLVAAGRNRKASNLIEKSWKQWPHPDLLAPYWESRGADTALARAQAAARLADTNPSHTQSRIMRAEQALDAELWGEARSYLSEFGDDAPARVCRLMAAIEEGEGRSAQAREWLLRASVARPDPAWTCSSCGHATPAWVALCAKCGDFDTLEWRTPDWNPAIPPAAGEGFQALIPTTGEGDAPLPNVAIIGGEDGRD